MVSAVKKLFYRLTNSIRMKMILCFVIIIMVLESVSIYSYLSGRRLNDLYNSTLEKHLLFNDIFVNLGSTNEFLQKYLQEDSKAALTGYINESKILLRSSSNLEFVVNNNGYVRETTDLKYMLQSYIEQADKSILLKQKHKLDESNSYYYDAADIYKLINKSFKDVYTIILQDTNRVKIKVIDNRNRLYTMNGILLLLVGVICLFFTRWISISLTKPIRNLTSYALQITKGDMSLPEMKITTHDEVAILSMAMSKMIARITSQIVEIKEKAELKTKLLDEEMEMLKIKNLLKESELKALQSRINPHFLFNTLNMISQTAYLEEADQTTSLLEVMAGLLRYNLDTFNKAVTIEAEIANLQDYVFIQQKRFGERIKFVFDVDSEIMKSRMPCLILQPLVENSIMHGVASYTEGGRIDIEIKNRNNRVILRICDNGVGISSENMEKLNEIISSNNIDYDTKGIGLHNVCARLRLFYNGDVEIKLMSEAGKNTEIIFDLPYWE